MGYELGQALRRLRKEAGHTLEQVASAARITPAALSQFETGKRDPSPKVLGLIAAALNCPVEPLQLLLDEERTRGRLEEAEYWRGSSQARRPDAAESTRLHEASGPPPSAPRYSRQPIENLFRGEAERASQMPVPEPAGMHGESPSSAEFTLAPQLEPRTSDLRHLARHATAARTRLEAIDALGDQASLALRTLRGLVDDEDPAVAREARRLLRELGLDVPVEKSEPEGEVR